MNKNLRGFFSHASIASAICLVLSAELVVCCEFLELLIRCNFHSVGTEGNAMKFGTDVNVWSIV